LFRQDSSKNGIKAEELTLQEGKAKDQTVTTCCSKAQPQTILVPVSTDLKLIKVMCPLILWGDMSSSNTDNNLGLMGKVP